MGAPTTQTGGTQLVTVDAAIGTSGATTRVFGIHILSTGGGGGVVALRNGTSTGDTIWVQETGTTSKGVTFFYGDKGFLFPNGCFVDIDNNTTSVAVIYSQ